MYGQSYVLKFTYIFLGMWQFNNRVLQKLYDLIIILIKLSYITYTVSQVLITPKVFLEDRPNKGGHVGILIVNAVNVLKVWVSQSKSIRILLQNLDQSEEFIIEFLDTKAKKIYEENIKKARSITPYYFFCLSFTLISFEFDYYLRLKGHFDQVNTTSNATYNNNRKEIPLLIYQWFPYNEQNYYVITTIWQQSTCLTGIFILGTTDLLFLSLIVYCRGQLDILIHVLKNRTNEGNNKSGITITYYRYRWCVIEHQRIIQFVKCLDETIRIVMLFDFIVRSLQIASILFQVKELGIDFMVLFAMFFCCLNLLEILFFYWHANEISIKSVAVSDAIWQSPWYTQDNTTRRLLALMMTRSQKPFAIHVGPLYAMSNQVLMQLLKSIYSFLAVMNSASETK